MRTSVITLMMMFAFTASQAQVISFDALIAGVTDDAAIKKELILNGFTKIRDTTYSDLVTYAYQYDDEEKEATIWVKIENLFADDSIAQSYGASTKWCTISIQSFGHGIHDYLKEEIDQYCTFEGIDVDDALEYKHKSKAVFSISSVEGTNMIDAVPPMDDIMEILMDQFEEYLEENPE